VFAGLSALMLLLCIAFGASWVVCMTMGVVVTVRRKRAARRMGASAAGVGSVGTGEKASPTQPLPSSDDPWSLQLSLKPEEDEEEVGVGAGGPHQGGLATVENPLLRARRLLGRDASVYIRGLVSGQASVSCRWGSAVWCCECCAATGAFCFLRASWDFVAPGSQSGCLHCGS
jgi:hypothetical protein